MNKTWTYTLASLLVGGTLALAGCGGSSGGSSGAATGTLSLGLTDGPIDADKVVIQFTGLEIKPEGGPPETYPFDSESCDDFDANMGYCTIDLLPLQGSEYRTVFLGELPAGPIQWIRLLVNAERNVMDSYIELSSDTNGDGESDNTMMCPLYIPSGSERGLQVIGGVTVTANGVSKYMLDFDVNKSVIQPPGLRVPPPEEEPLTEEEMCAQNYLLKPVIRMVDETEAGSISGVIDSSVFPVPGCNEDDLEVYVYEDFADPPAAMRDDYDGDAGDPVASAMAEYDTDNMWYSYEVGFLSAGSYLLGLACNTDLDDPEEDEFDSSAQGLQECETADDPPQAAFCFIDERTVTVEAEMMMTDINFPDDMDDVSSP
jgi:hypothetical protein